MTVFSKSVQILHTLSRQYAHPYKLHYTQVIPEQSEQIPVYTVRVVLEGQRQADPSDETTAFESEHLKQLRG